MLYELDSLDTLVAAKCVAPTTVLRYTHCCAPCNSVDVRKVILDPMHMYGIA
jgi:hypothetical protein